MKRIHRIVAPAAILPLFALAACTTTPRPVPPGETAPTCLSPADAPAVATPPAPVCEDARLTGHDALLVLAPHPDDEVLGFAGLIDAYVRQGKPVEVVVVTDGDAYCEACRFWKSGSVDGPPCSAEELWNPATPEADSFAEVRREESRRALAILGAGEPVFLGAPDIGLRISWRRIQIGDPSRPLARSDFSSCTDCATCTTGYLQGPESHLTPASLLGALVRHVDLAPAGTLLATTHPLDHHSDHSGLGNLVKRINDARATPRPVAYAVIHAHTAKDLPLPECWYPGPRAVQCGCAVEACAERDPGWLAALRSHRDRPEWPAALPDDAPYGEAVQLCLPEAVWAGPEALKRRAIASYGSQLGTALRAGEPAAHLSGILDCNGYLGAFVRSTEAFVLSEPAGEGAPCDPTGTWVGERGEMTAEGRAGGSAAELELARAEDGGIAGILVWTDREGNETEVTLRGMVGTDCRLELETVEPAPRTIEATLSRDRKSLYGQWQAPAGYLAVHR